MDDGPGHGHRKDEEIDRQLQEIHDCFYVETWYLLEICIHQHQFNFHFTWHVIDIWINIILCFLSVIYDDYRGINDALIWKGFIKFNDKERWHPGIVSFQRYVKASSDWPFVWGELFSDWWIPITIGKPVMPPVCINHIICIWGRCIFNSVAIALWSVTCYFQNQYRLLPYLKVGFMLASDEITSYIANYYTPPWDYDYLSFWSAFTGHMDTMCIIFVRYLKSMRPKMITISNTTSRHFRACWLAPTCFARLDAVSLHLAILSNIKLLM